MAKTKQQGYYRLKSADKWLHFSMNCWVNLKQDSGKDVGTFQSDLADGDLISRFITLCDIAYAAMKAYDQEEKNEIDYDIYDVRKWMEGLEEDDSMEFVEAMTHSLTLPGKTSKKQAKK